MRTTSRLPEDGFPTPHELQIDRTPLIRAAMIRIGEQLRAKYRGDETIVDITPDELKLRNDLTPLFETKGWHVKFGDCQREGTWVTLTPKAGA